MINISLFELKRASDSIKCALTRQEKCNLSKRAIQLILLILTLISTSIITAIITVNLILNPEKNEKELIGQGAPTDVSYYLKQASSNQKRHYTLGVEMHGEGAYSSEDEGHKVAIYGAASTGQKGNPDIWAGNFLAQINSGLPYKKEQGVNAQGIEVDLNNNQGDYYSSWDWKRGNAVGINITSGGKFPISSGLLIGSTRNNNYPAHGIILDNGTKESGVLFLGDHPIGIDFSQSNTQNAIVLSDNQDITYKNKEGNKKLILSPSENGFEVLGINYKIRNAEPMKPQPGLIVYADGDKWNPGNGEGLYLYKSSGWFFLG
jgi:hypothetical protein